jgi:hypothetical protein
VKSSTSAPSAALVLAGLLFLAVGPTALDAAVTLRIENQSGREVWVKWTGMSALTGQLAGGGQIAPSDFGDNAEGYRLHPSRFAQPAPNVYEIPGYTVNGGRMWFTYGSSSWSFLNPGYSPAPHNFNDPNFTRRYDKIEAYIMGSPGDVLGLAALDYFSIPFRAEAWNSADKAATHRILKGSPGEVVAAALFAAAANPAAPAPSGTPALPKITQGSPYLIHYTGSLGADTPAPFTHSPIDASGAFVRAASNASRIFPLATDPVPAGHGGTPPANYLWQTFHGYVAHLDGSAPGGYTGPTRLKGPFFGAGLGLTPLTAPSEFDALVSFTPGEERRVTYTLPGSGPGTGPFDLTFIGFATIAGSFTPVGGAQQGVPHRFVIKIPYGAEFVTVDTPGFTDPGVWMLNPSGIIGANANYLYKSWREADPEPADFQATDPFDGGPQNNLLTKVAGDLFAGMNIGAVGSGRTFATALVLNGNTYPAGTPVGAFFSNDWWSLGAALRGSVSESVYDYYFDFLQPDRPFYNTYAAALYPYTDAFAFVHSGAIVGGRVNLAWDATSPTAFDIVKITLLPDSAPGYSSGYTYSEWLGRRLSSEQFSDPAFTAPLALLPGTGLPNLLHYLLGRADGVGPATPPTLAPAGGGVFRYHVPRNPEARGFRVCIETSQTLAADDWVTVATSENGAPPTGAGVVGEIAGSPPVMVIGPGAGEPEGVRRFYRVRVDPLP